MGNARAIYYAIGHAIGILLFPGVIVHEAAHVAFCILFGVRVYDVCYFKIGKGLGYVSYDRPALPVQRIIIGLSPLLINPLLGFGLGALLLFPAWHHLVGGPLYNLYCWLGVSIAAMGAPSMTDVSEARGLMIWSRSALVRGLSSCVFGIATIAVIASVFLLNVVCGFAVFFAPSLIWK